MNQGSLYVISAASGTGKTSLVKSLVEKTSQLEVSISHTTRPKRPNEIDGIHYFFVSKNEFEKLIERNEFIEHALVFQNFYGTSKTQVLNKLACGIDIILEIDWQGAQQIRQTFSDSISIFILPPSLKTLQQRLNYRGQDSDEVIMERLQKSCLEISHYHEFDYIVINDSFDNALVDLQSIIRATKCNLKQHHREFSAFVDDLLKKSC